MNESLLESHEELKRLEHIIYVSLKYTRTVDIIINALNRLLSVFDLLIEAMLEKAREEKLLINLPKSPALRATQLGELYPEEKELQDYLSFYAFLKTVLKLPNAKREEFRRHVTLVVELDKCTAEIDIDNLTNCERIAHNFFRYVLKKVEGRVDDD